MKKPLSRRLKEYRKHIGLNQSELADLIGVPQTTYREWENGRNILGEQNYMKLAEVFEISLHELVTGEISDKHQLVKETDQLIEQLMALRTKLLSFE